MYAIRSYYDQGRVAVLFGREQSGLSNAEIDRCHYLVRIPSSPVYASLNLAAAVQVIAYELFVAHVTKEPEEGGCLLQHVPVSAGEMERFYEHLEATLVVITSYSIHYTKLYEAPRVLPAFRVQAGKRIESDLQPACP